jgi:6-phosphogluconolactonase
VTFTPDGRHLIAADLGTDRLEIYRYNSTTGTIAPRHRIGTEPGSGPRHITFHPNGLVCYVVQELSSTVSVYSHNAETGELCFVESVSARDEWKAANPATAPDDRGLGLQNTSADIHIDRSGTTLYCSNRGDDTIAVFHVRQNGLRLVPGPHVSSGGRTPRNFALSPEETYLVVANQDSDTVVSLKSSRSSGSTPEIVDRIPISHPVCVLFA